MGSRTFITSTYSLRVHAVVTVLTESCSVIESLGMVLSCSTVPLRSVCEHHTQPTTWHEWNAYDHDLSDLLVADCSPPARVSVRVCPSCHCWCAVRASPDVITAAAADRGQRGREAEGQRDRAKERQRGRETERQRDRETERQRDREIERQRGREAERQRDRETETERHRDRDREAERQRDRGTRRRAGASGGHRGWDSTDGLSRT
jgi:hypothetical protein